jgi:hypothetical protein
MYDDESYWKDADGSINEGGHQIAEAFKKNSNISQPDKPLNEDGNCTICFKPEDRVARKLIEIGKTSKKELPIWVCRVCDAGALGNASSQPS